MIRLQLDRPWLELDLGAPMQVLSWSINRPGFVVADRILWREVRNADLPKALDVREWFAAELRTRRAEDAIGFLTSRDIRAFHQAEARVGAGVEACHAHCVATVGLSNAERVGHRVDYSARDWGTINVALVLNQGLSQTGLIEALSIVTQARTTAVLEVGFSTPHGIATGTGTDCIAVAAPMGDVDFAGLHTDLGEAIGAACYQAVLSGAQEWRETTERK